MFKIHGNDIYITRGDCATFDIHPMESDGTTPYIMDVNDYLKLRVYNLGCRRDVLTARTEAGGITFNMNGEDTRKLAPGKYGYNVKLVFANGSETTIIGVTPVFVPHFIVAEG